MYLKVIIGGSEKYYGGKDKKGEMIFTDKKRAKEYSPRAKGSLNQVIYDIEKNYGGKCEYVEN